MTHRLEVDGVMLDFGSKRVLSDVYMRCETGRITGLLGRNGQGKTCLMNIVYGSLAAASKSVRFDGVSIFHAFARPDLLVYLPQFFFMPASLTLKRIFSDFELPYAEFERWFPEFAGRYRTALGSLSGGQRRLVEVYVMAKAKSRFAMLDEPFSHLMPFHVEKIQEILGEEKQKKGFLITDHLYRQVAGICDHLYVLRDGKTFLTRDMADLETLGYARL